MKKLGKKTYSTRESIQAYACSSCSCGCSCASDPFNHDSLQEDAGWSKSFGNVSWGY